MSSPFPRWLEDAIEDLLGGHTLGDLQEAYATLSYRYRTQPGASGFASELETLAYLAARLPATYAVVRRCLKELPKGFIPENILDLGAGPGTASLACLEAYPPTALTLIEQNKTILGWGKRLFAAAPNAPTLINYQNKNLLNLSVGGSYDMVIASYVFGELSPNHQETLLQTALDMSSKYLLIILPGTPAGFGILRSLRELAIGKGSHVLAPCTHQKSCPMGENDWCHFPVRLPRSSWHKRLKGGELGYEDEKFSYLILSKEPMAHETQAGRIIKKPHHGGGHGTIDVCSQGELSTVSYSRKKFPNYRNLKDLEWGDEYPPS